METSTKTGGRFGLVESLTAVEFDADREVFQAAYDSTRESASLAVVTVVATVLDKNPIDLPPLASAINTDALDRLVAGSTGKQGCDSISFQYEGINLTLTSGGQIEADPMDNA